MSKMITENSTDTESIGKVIKNAPKSEVSFDYKNFCKEIMDMHKSNMDACFLMPLKLYHSKKNIGLMDTIPKIQLALDKFSELFDKDCIYFWLCMDYWMKNNTELSDEDWREYIKYIKENYHTIISDTKSLIADASKLEKTKYVKELCKKRAEIECWILNVYELMLRKLYDAFNMRLLAEKIITYLEKSQIKIQTTIFVSQDEKYIFKIASSLILLVIRLRLKIDPKDAAKWYNEGNKAYYNDGDRMLEEYILITGKYSYLSYERFIRLKDIATNGNNKYAAKEVGDVYRLGATLVDYYENRIFIDKDKEKARQYYYICVENEYIPAYISIIKMGILIDKKQEESLLQQAKESGDLEGLIFYADQCLKMADEYCQTNRQKALERLRDAVGAISVLEDTCAAKHILKSELLLSKAFEIVRGGNEEENVTLSNILQELYLSEIIKIDKQDLYREVEKIYVSAQEQEYYEAEYRLGKLFQDMDVEKSEKYFEQGREKGCKWCMLESSRTLKAENAKEWLKVMIKLEKNVQGNEELQECIAKELVEAEEVWEAVKNKQIKLESHEIAEIYLLLYHSVTYIDGKMETSTRRMKKKADLVCKLTDIMEQIESWRDDGGKEE